MCHNLRYLFVDMNSYFASVEQHLRPELRGRPVAVVPVKAETTCCIAASYEAKAHGVKTGTSVADARRLCRGIRFVEARPEEYIRLHHRIIAAVESCLPVSAVLSVDEMVCKLWGPDREPEQAVELGTKIKAAIRDQIGPTMRCSIGIGPNRLLAKTASDMQKPDGLTVIGLDDLPRKLFDLKLRDFCGIGPRMGMRLERFGISTVEQLCRATESELSQVWGSKVLGSAWWRKLRGEDVAEPPTVHRSVGHSHVLPPELRTDELARRVLVRMVHKAAVRLRAMKYWARGVDVQVSYLGRDHWHGSQRLPPTQDTLALIRAANELWKRKPPGKPLKVGVVFHNLTAAKNTPGCLLEEDRRQHDLAKTIDDVNQRFGNDAVYFGGMHDMQESAPLRIAFNRVPEIVW